MPRSTMRPPAASSPLLDFGFQPLGSIGDLIYHDANGDGVYEPNDGDFPLANVPVTLTMPDGTSQTMVTDSTGMYLFTDLPLDATYTVMVETSGLVDKENAPSADPDGGADSVSEVRLTQAEPNDLDQDFGYEPTPDAPTLGAIGDTIFHDADGDGLYEPEDGDFPLENVTVLLTDASGNTQSMSTNENGLYLFSSLPLGDYTVTVDPATLPDGKRLTPSADPDGGSDNSSSVSLTEAAPVDLDQDYGYEPDQLGSIGDLIFHDANGDGVYDPNAGDFPLQAITVTLTDATGNTQSTTTDASGNYLFEDLPLDATYTVIVDTSGLMNKESVPSADPDGGADSISVVTLTLATPDDLDQDFGYEPTPDAPTLGVIGDTIFHDADADGVYEPADGDFPLAGVTVTLTGPNGSQSVVTDENGQYVFSNLPLGEYVITVDTSTLPDGKLLDPTADPDGGGDNTSTVQPTPENPVDLNQDFGYQPFGSIGDLIFHDANRDGLMNRADGDLPLPTVTVNLLDSSGNVIATTTTNSDGEYLFENLPLGDYTVQVDTTTLPSDKLAIPTADPDGGADGIGDNVSQVTLTPVNPDNREQDFGYERDPILASLGNWFWFDENNDGLKGPNEPAVAGAMVNLYDELGNIVATTTTDANGFFEFIVQPGTYVLEFDPPPGYTFTTPGTPGAINSDVDRNTGFTTEINLTAGENDTSWSAGVVQVPTAVNLSSFTVDLRNESELVIRWTTSAEFDTAGFHILRSSDGTQENARQVTDQLMPSQGSNGGNYELVLPYTETVEPPLSLLSFWLYEVETGGGINIYGPAVLDLDAADMDQFMFLPFLSQ